MFNSFILGAKVIIIKSAENGFNLSSVLTLITALIAALVSLWGIYVQKKTAWKNQEIQKTLKQREIDSNIKSKSRIEWIQKVREEAADLIANCTLFYEYSSTRKLGKPESVTVEKGTNGKVQISAEQEPDEVRESTYSHVVLPTDIEEIRVQINKASNKLILYFGPDENGDNEKIVHHVKNILEIVNNKNKLDYSELKNISNTLRDCLKKYLKTEWKRAKKGE